MFQVLRAIDLIFFQPFVHEEQGIHNYFPDRFYAVALPLLAGVIGLALIGKKIQFIPYSLLAGVDFCHLLITFPNSLNPDQD